MSALTDRIAREHYVYRVYVHDDLACTGCDWTWQRSAAAVANGSLDVTEVQAAAAAHIANVTEAAVREQVARDIEAERDDPLQCDPGCEVCVGLSDGLKLAARITRGEQ